MKTKDQLIKKIKELKATRNYAKTIHGSDRLVSICDGAILALQYALEYNVNKYWCFKCGYLHNNLKCPTCGDTTPISTKQIVELNEK